MNPKQVIVMRKDLNMRKGKMVAQGAHASMGAVFAGSKVFYDPSSGQKSKIVPMSDATEAWFNERFTKVCLGCDSEKELIAIAEAAAKAELPHFLCRDAGLTEFNGVPTLTCLAIGPADSADIDVITGKLKLL